MLKNIICPVLFLATLIWIQNCAAMYDHMQYAGAFPPTQASYYPQAQPFDPYSAMQSQYQPNGFIPHNPMLSQYQPNGFMPHNPMLSQYQPNGFMPHNPMLSQYQPNGIVAYPPMQSQYQPNGIVEYYPMQSQYQPNGFAQYSPIQQYPYLPQHYGQVSRPYKSPLAYMGGQHSTASTKAGYFGGAAGAAALLGWWPLVPPLAAVALGYGVKGYYDKRSQKAQNEAYINSLNGGPATTRSRGLYG